LIQALTGRGLRIVLTGGPAAEEREFCERLVAAAPASTVSVAGKFSFAQLTALLERATLFVGPDTSVTHQAAACGTPTVAVYGPTNPVKWGPWPAGFAEDRSPYENKALAQRVNNVLLVQPPGDCVPCHQEGCDRHKASYSRCLQTLPGDTVIAAALQMLAGKETRSA
jgi:heptosyltransferase-3